jgi:hypothetical protein
MVKNKSIDNIDNIFLPKHEKIEDKNNNGKKILYIIL